MHKLIAFTLFLFFSYTLHAQEQWDFSYYNNETYQLYMDADWNSLIQLGKESITAGHDFYYLRFRMGIAYFEQKKYIQANRHFEKALEFTPGSLDVKSYLYYSYLYLGRAKEANKYYGSVDDSIKFFSAAFFESGIKLSDNKANTRNTRFAFVGLGHNLGKSVSLFHGYQRLTADFALPPDNIIPSLGPGPGPIANETIYSVNQNEYYAALTILAAKGLYLIPAFHYQGVKSDTYEGKNKVIAFQLAKWLDKLKLYAGLSYSEINDLNQNQYEAGLVFYPMGNHNLYIQSQITYHSQDSKHNLVSFNKVGIKLFTTTWIDLFFSYGDMVNYSDMNAYVVYNQLDAVNSRIGITINQSLGKHLIYLNYTRENKEEYLTETRFAHNDFIIGVNIKF